MPERHPAGPLCRCQHRLAAHVARGGKCDGLPRDHGGCPCPTFRPGADETVRVCLVKPEAGPILATTVIELEDGRRVTGWVVP